MPPDGPRHAPQLATGASESLPESEPDLEPNLAPSPVLCSLETSPAFPRSQGWAEDLVALGGGRRCP